MRRVGGTDSLMRGLRKSCALGLMVALGACAPSMDWRELRVDDTALQVTWPCKPASHARTVPLGEQSVRWTLYACEAGGATWGLGWMTLSGPDQVPAALTALKTLAAQNWAGPVSNEQMFVPTGATPFAQSARFEVKGRGPNGAPLSVQAAVFAQGSHVFQATAMGTASPEALQAWWAGLRANP